MPAYRPRAGIKSWQWHAGAPQFDSLQGEDLRACMTACPALQGYYQAVPQQGRGRCLLGICQTPPSTVQLTGSRHHRSQRLPPEASSITAAWRFLCQHSQCLSSMGAAPSSRKDHLPQHWAKRLLCCMTGQEVPGCEAGQRSRLCQRLSQGAARQKALPPAAKFMR